MKSKITIKDIAKELGISTSTVSRALKDNPNIKKETRDKVQAFAKLYHYKPNSLALKLRSNKTMTIGVIIPEITHHFFSKVISGIEKIANANDYNVMICLSNESYEKEALNMKLLVDGNVDGLLVSIAKETLKKRDFEHFNLLKDYGIPLVLFDRISDQVDCDKVIVDDLGASYKATKHLIDKGCKNIALITTPDHVTVGCLRRLGYEKALQESGFEVKDTMKIKIDESLPESLQNQIENFLSIPSKVPDGIVAVNEIYAAHALKTVMNKGIKVPEDMAIIGFTDGLISEFSTPTLSTVKQHGYTMGMLAGELLFNRILSESVEEPRYETKVISTEIKSRDSTLKFVKKVF